MLSPEQSRLRGGLMAAAAPHRARVAALSSALCDSDRARGNAWSCVRGGAAGGEGKGLHQRAVGMEQLPRAVGAAWSCRNSGSIWTVLSDITEFECWVVLHGAKDWSQ